MQHFNNYSFTVRSDIGTREEQQDSFVCVQSSNSLLAIVCDGMGGLKGGAVASETASENLAELFRCKDSNESFYDFFYNSIDVLDESVFNLMDCESGERLDCGTTLVAAGIERDIIFWLLVGDSRLYLIRNNEIEQSNRDHNYSLILDNSDLTGLSKEQIEKERKKANALISYVGMGGIEIFNLNNGFKILDNDIFLLTTDGLFKILTDNEIKEIIMSFDDVDKAADALLDMVRRKEPRDNVTFILIKAGG